MPLDTWPKPTLAEVEESGAREDPASYSPVAASVIAGKLDSDRSENS